MGPNKIGKGRFTLYLKECPKCGNQNRKLDSSKIFGSAAMTAGASITGSIFGAPLVGYLAAIGLINALVAGTIAYPVARYLIKWNYESLKKLREKKIYTCPECDCTDLTKFDLHKNQENKYFAKQKNDDLTNQIIDHLIRELKKEEEIDVRNNIEVMKRIEKAAKKAKKDLLKNETTHVNLPYLVLSSKGPTHLDVTIKRTQLGNRKN